jgi:hypothetical protein
MTLRATSMLPRVALGAWVGGWMTGPVAAVVIYLTGRRDPRAWSTTYAWPAAVFWLMVVAAHVVNVAVNLLPANGSTGHLLLVGAAYVSAAVVATITAVVRVVRRPSVIPPPTMPPPLRHA